MEPLSSKPILNPALTAALSSLFGNLKNKTSSIKSDSSVSFWWIFIGIAAFLTLIIWYYKASRKLETAANIRRMTYDMVKTSDFYMKNVTNRQSLRSYMEKLEKEGLPASHTALTNFYISTVNAAGIFFPSEDGIASPEAAKLAVHAGARAFVFDIWPDLTPGANFGPILQIVEGNSLWRRITMNHISFSIALNTIIQTVFSGGLNPGGTVGAQDLVVLYLRFRGNPRPQTYEGVASALRSAIEPYRLGIPFYSCRGQDRLFKTSILHLMQKVIVVSNHRAIGSSLQDYINIGPKTGVRLEWTPKDVLSLSDSMLADQKRLVQQNLSFVLFNPEDERAEENKWDLQPSLDMGIHCPAVNLWKKSNLLTTYMKADMFGIYSYKIKPYTMRYIMDILPKPDYPVDPKWGTGPTAGTPTVPEPLRLP